MSLADFIEVLKMVKEAEKEMRPARFWTMAAAAVGASGGWLAYGLAKLVDVLK